MCTEDMMSSYSRSWSAHQQNSNQRIRRSSEAQCIPWEGCKWRLLTSLKFTINWNEWRTCLTKPQHFHRLFHDMLGSTLFVCSSGHATRMSTVHRHQRHYFFSSLPHDNNPSRYDFLSDFKDELAEDNFITKFASRGPKHGYLTKKEKNAMQGESH